MFNNYLAYPPLPQSFHFIEITSPKLISDFLSEYLGSAQLTEVGQKYCRLYFVERILNSEKSIRDSLRLISDRSGTIRNSILPDRCRNGMALIPRASFVQPYSE